MAAARAGLQPLLRRMTSVPPASALPPLLDTGSPFVRATAAAAADVGDGRHVHVEPEFVTAAEEATLVAEADRRLRSTPYEDGHFDAVIHRYRELLGFKHIAPANAAILARAEARTFALCGSDPSFVFLPVHILDLAPDGYILPHLDNYCGRTVAAVCLLADAVMRLTRPDRPDAVVELLLPRRGYYCLQYALAPTPPDGEKRGHRVALVLTRLHHARERRPGPVRQGALPLRLPPRGDAPAAALA